MAYFVMDYCVWQWKYIVGCFKMLGAINLIKAKFDLSDWYIRSTNIFEQRKKSDSWWKKARIPPNAVATISDSFGYRAHRNFELSQSRIILKKSLRHIHDDPIIEPILLWTKIMKVALVAIILLGLGRWISIATWTSRSCVPPLVWLAS